MSSHTARHWPPLLRSATVTFVSCRPLFSMCALHAYQRPHSRGTDNQIRMTWWPIPEHVHVHVHKINLIWFQYIHIHRSCYFYYFRCVCRFFSFFFFSFDLAASLQQHIWPLLVLVGSTHRTRYARYGSIFQCDLQYIPNHFKPILNAKWNLCITSFFLCLQFRVVVVTALLLLLLLAYQFQFVAWYTLDTRLSLWLCVRVCVVLCVCVIAMLLSFITLPRRTRAMCICTTCGHISVNVICVHGRWLQAHYRLNSNYIHSYMMHSYMCVPHFINVIIRYGTMRYNTWLYFKILWKCNLILFKLAEVNDRHQHGFFFSLDFLLRVSCVSVCVHVRTCANVAYAFQCRACIVWKMSWKHRLNWMC